MKQSLHQAVKAMDSKATIQHNKLMQLENSMLMYGIYNAETLEKLINTVHNIHNTTSSHERLFAGQQRFTNTQKHVCKHSRFTSLLLSIHYFISEWFMTNMLHYTGNQSPNYAHIHNIY